MQPGAVMDFGLEDLERIGQLLGAAIFAIGGAMIWLRKNVPAPPTPAPKPTTSPEEEAVGKLIEEVRATYREMRDLMQRNHSVTADDQRDILKTMDRIENQLARVEASMRLIEAMHRLQQHK